MPVHFGIDRLVEEPALLLDHLSPVKRVGLVTNDAATTGAASPHPLRPGRVALRQAGIPPGRPLCP